MKTNCFILIVLFVFGCAAQQQNKDVLTVYDLAEKIEYDNKYYYVVDVDDLRRANRPSSITYVGTIDSYHLFQEWSKLKVKEGEIFTFAAPKHSCVVHDMAPPDNEEYYYTNVFKQQRHVSLENGQCSVPPRKLSQRNNKQYKTL